MVDWMHTSRPGDLEPVTYHVYCQNGVVFYPGEVCLVVSVVAHGLEMQKAWFVSSRGRLGWLYQRNDRETLKC